MADQTGGMGKLSARTKAKVDEALSEKESALLKNTAVNLESLRPKISDKESFDKLLEVVRISTQNKESAAELQQRITSLGAGVIKVAKDVLSAIK